MVKEKTGSEQGTEWPISKLKAYARQHEVFDDLTGHEFDPIARSTSPG
jgi:hypothetical protein